ncbi:MAG: MmcQ/YjbR family DNA-binding protein [Gammaproteobacteria bacterium]|nr:MmcQ/YjbR family DNA-binding protein [Gammaproteobacteria bacterium]
MKVNKLEETLGKQKGAEGSNPFGPEALVFKVMGKMFALVSQKEEMPRITLKCRPADGEVLVSQYDSISPGYYMNKRHWITISLSGELPEEMILDLANGSYDLVVSKLTKADKKKLEACE